MYDLITSFEPCNFILTLYLAPGDADYKTIEPVSSLRAIRPSLVGYANFVCKQRVNGVTKGLKVWHALMSLIFLFSCLTTGIFNPFNFLN